ncbi:tRNA-splicing endonuclease subunit Sen34 isoform X1 [Camarhynchus parvulus]|uniref:tRNA-splicing endonuclease subunit Sen34 isoform X1 n=1 Tax=Geospiza parvula TaxID=87175 RepID=UPI001237AFB1|nr:tRNA-splicing endonuclease subunit Sen34 isoform X1 [Camarhynchus parvulus]
MAAGPEGVPGVCGGGEGSETPGTPPDALTERPRVRRHRGRFLVWAPRAARALRERHRVWGALVGTPPRRGRAGAGAAGPRLPLELSPEEARALRESGGATVEPVDEAEAEPEETPPEPSRPSSPSERRFRVFRELWGRGLHVTPGGKFGGDFLVYPGPPSLFHAGAVALCPCSSQAQPLGALLAAARLGTSVRKSLLLCSAPPGGAMAVTALTWRADLT